MDRLLITGVDGVLGANLAVSLRDRWKILGLYSRQPVAIDGVETALAAEHYSEAPARVLRDFQPRWTIHCGAASLGSWDLPITFEANVCAHEARAVAHLSEACTQSGTRLTVVTTDAVFSGPWLFHDEASATATSARAAQLLSIEQCLEHTDALVVRSHVYGWSPIEGHAGLAERLSQALSASSEVAADGRRYSTPILASDLAELLQRAFTNKLQGLFHITGAERTSIFRFSQQMAAAFGLPGPRVQPASAWLQVPSESCHEETSLNCRRARRALEMPMPLLREGLARFAQQADSGWRDSWHSAGCMPVASQAA